ncbi:hypothetical protein Kpho01_25370 [Kitasatospora phosalacinea]|uniref:Uncharacterized protein n=1 Tax=Kitasatospora phosalacinea TaxID=2065 RepID=A0A9W6PGN8_9ACTN|nr:hypothetical protein Kpho01_25370 [Kitasatospora phosalacinea]
MPAAPPPPGRAAPVLGRGSTAGPDAPARFATFPPEPSSPAGGLRFALTASGRRLPPRRQVARREVARRQVAAGALQPASRRRASAVAEAGSTE